MYMVSCGALSSLFYRYDMITVNYYLINQTICFIRWDITNSPRKLFCLSHIECKMQFPTSGKKIQHYFIRGNSHCTEFSFLPTDSAHYILHTAHRQWMKFGNSPLDGNSSHWIPLIPLSTGRGHYIRHWSTSNFDCCLLPSLNEVGSLKIRWLQNIECHYPHIGRNYMAFGIQQSKFTTS